MKKFSLIIPTRKRRDFFTKFCDSIKNKTNVIESIELLAVIDNDDLDAQDYAHQGDFIRVLSRERGNNLSLDYHTWACKQSCGEYIFILNDDAIMTTDNWDIIAYNELNKKNVDGIIYGRTANPSERSTIDFSFFPILGRKGIDILGFAMSPNFPGWQADVHIYHVYKKLDKVIDIRDIYIDHVQGWRINDECNHNMRSMTKHVHPHIFDEIVTKDVQTIKNYMEQKIYL